MQAASMGSPQAVLGVSFLPGSIRDSWLLCRAPQEELCEARVLPLTQQPEQDGGIAGSLSHHPGQRCSQPSLHLPR